MKPHRIRCSCQQKIFICRIYLFLASRVRPNKKMSVFRVTSLKILGRVGTHIVLIGFFSGKNIILCIFPENLKKF